MKTVFLKKDVLYLIYIPKKFDNGQISEICTNIKKSLTKDNYYRADIVLLSDEDFSGLDNSKDKYRESETNEYYLQKKI